MLYRLHRLNKQKDFDGIFRQGGVSQDNFLAVRFLPNQRSFSRFGLVVSAKAAPKAADRNRLRRQLSEIIRLNLSRIKPGWDMAVIVKAKIAQVEYGQMQEILVGLLRKKNLYV